MVPPTEMTPPSTPDFPSVSSSDVSLCVSRPVTTGASQVKTATHTRCRVVYFRECAPLTCSRTIQRVVFHLPSTMDLPSDWELIRPRHPHNGRQQLPTCHSPHALIGFLTVQERSGFGNRGAHPAVLRGARKFRGGRNAMELPKI
jgi:hypothetical protein